MSNNTPRVCICTNSFRFDSMYFCLSHLNWLSVFISFSACFFLYACDPLLLRCCYPNNLHCHRRPTSNLPYNAQFLLLLLLLCYVCIHFYLFHFTFDKTFDMLFPRLFPIAPLHPCQIRKIVRLRRFLLRKKRLFRLFFLQNFLEVSQTDYEWIVVNQFSLGGDFITIRI